MNAYALLGIAIVLELFSTSMMKASEGFTKLIPSIVFIGGMGSSFYLMSQALTTIPLSIAYAIWSGVGTSLTTLIGILVWKEQLNIYSGIGIVLIVIGVVLLNLKASGH
ncbi:DMT family transporter [Sporomusa malonica]|uniref:Small multidrug resistance pump n=1 Tax=Sporomusa malonica TaxID=112901 RepID=A0A1W2DU22_9FIRM|nr:multidrug efflux SMR transporter [Sporomusa malonica]SMD00522.1 small multidrug resistance pump [Sporomusa malonica]